MSSNNHRYDQSIEDFDEMEIPVLNDDGLRKSQFSIDQVEEVIDEIDVVRSNTPPNELIKPSDELQPVEEDIAPAAPSVEKPTANKQFHEDDFLMADEEIMEEEQLKKKSTIPNDTVTGNASNSNTQPEAAPEPQSKQKVDSKQTLRKNSGNKKSKKNLADEDDNEVGNDGEPKINSPPKRRADGSLIDDDFGGGFGISGFNPVKKAVPPLTSSNPAQAKSNTSSTKEIPKYHVITEADLADEDLNFDEGNETQEQKEESPTNHASPSPRSTMYHKSPRNHLLANINEQVKGGDKKVDDGDQMKKPPKAKTMQNSNSNHQLSAQEMTEKAEEAALKDKQDRMEKLQLKKLKKGIENVQHHGGQHHQDDSANKDADPNKAIKASKAGNKTDRSATDDEGGPKTKRTGRKNSRENGMYSHRENKEPGESDVETGREGESKAPVKKTGRNGSVEYDPKDMANQVKKEKPKPYDAMFPVIKVKGKKEDHSHASIVAAMSGDKAVVASDNESQRAVPKAKSAPPKKSKFPAIIRRQVKVTQHAFPEAGQDLEMSADDISIHKSYNEKDRDSKMPHSSPERNSKKLAEPTSDSKSNKKPKPLYLRMIARANRKIMEEEKQKVIIKAILLLTYGTIKSSLSHYHYSMTNI
jgi:hypothetical protein